LAISVENLDQYLSLFSINLFGVDERSNIPSVKVFACSWVPQCLVHFLKSL